MLISLGLSRPAAAAGPVEHEWDRNVSRTNLQKSGPASNAWHTGARLEAFTAEIFADPKNLF